MTTLQKTYFCKICKQQLEAPFINHLNGVHGISKMGREAWRYTEGFYLMGQA